MITYTKRIYLAEIAANEAAIAAVQSELADYAARVETGECVHALSEAWNAAHDREYDLEQERFEIERRWSQRRWTGADHARRELIAANID